MFEQEKVTNQNVYIKIAGTKRPVSLFVKDWTAAGIWVQSEDLHLELAQLADEQGMPGFLEKNPVIFLPHHRIEWVMVSDVVFLQVREVWDARHPRRARLACEAVHAFQTRQLSIDRGVAGMLLAASVDVAP